MAPANKTTPATISVLEELLLGVIDHYKWFRQLEAKFLFFSDIFKALALGAQAVLVGRPAVFGRAAMGENGMKRVIEMLKNELELGPFWLS